jgi:trehalose-phosphatase
MSAVLNRALGGFKGVLVEDKGLSLSVHYRLAEASQAGEIKDIVKKVVAGAEPSGQMKITAGKKVYEIRPALAWDKGKAIKYL